MIKFVIALSFLAVQFVFAQPFYLKSDSLSTVTLSTSYFDLLRTKNSTSNTAISFQKTSAQFETSFGEDRLFFSIETGKNNIQVENGISLLHFKTGQSIHRLTADNEFSFNPFFAELFLRVNQIRSVSTLDYGGSFGFRNSSHWFERFRIGYYSYSFPWIFGLRYQDSEIDINNMTMLTKVFYEIGFHPIKKTGLTFQYEKYISSKNKNENPVFAVDDKSAGSLAKLIFTNSSFIIPVEINFFHGQGESFFDLFYSQNSFSQNSFTDALYNGIKLKGSESIDYQWIPSISIRYDFFKGSMVGNIQSWPFTSVLTSFIANRINYRLTGQVYLFSLEAEKRFTFSCFSIQPELSLHQILPEVTLDNWQPSYLVFGVKDFSRNILPVRKALIGKISFSASYQLKFCTFILQAGQFIPLQIIKKELPASAVSPVVIITQAGPSKIDGGRWISFSIRAGF
ncbi:MAG: hypothetical protein M0P61_10980 [Ignavibacteriaceae bacterium]|nr:hypothetical protein [Ignavibacteriaceae bacterium]